MPKGAFRRAESPLLIALLVLIGWGPVRPALGQASPERPNVVVLFTDDQRADALGAAGNPYLRTPVMDSLAASGFRFRNTYVMGGHHGAICAPSRAMLMTGRSLFHVYDNLDTLRTFPQQLGAAGYTTFGTGKWHNSRDSFAKSFQEGRHVFFGGMSNHDKVPLRDLQPDGSYTAVDTMGFSSTLFADAAIAFIEQQADAETQQPFLAYVAFTAPHDPRMPPAPYRTAYGEEAVPIPPNFMPLHPFNLGPGTMAVRDEHLAPWPRPVDMVRSQISEYYGLVTHMDAQIGRVMQALRRHGLREHTVVVLAGDNGLALGAHGLMGKQSLYEHSTRVPLIVAGPGIPSGSSDALVYLYDIAPTIFELTGIEGLARMDGRSLAPLWRGARAAGRPTLFTAYTNAIRAVRGERWKLIDYPRIGYTQLFDLRSDPYELNNRADDPAYAEQLEQLRDQLHAWQERADDPLAQGAPARARDPVQRGEALPMDYDYSHIERRADPWQPDWIVEKYFAPDSSFSEH